MIRIPKKVAIDNNLPYKLFTCQFMLYEDKPSYLGRTAEQKIIGPVDKFEVLSYNKRIEKIILPMSEQIITDADPVVIAPYMNRDEWNDRYDNTDVILTSIPPYDNKYSFDFSNTFSSDPSGNAGIYIIYATDLKNPQLSNYVVRGKYMGNKSCDTYGCIPVIAYDAPLTLDDFVPENETDNYIIEVRKLFWQSGYVYIKWLKFDSNYNIQLSGEVVPPNISHQSMADLLHSPLIYVDQNDNFVYSNDPRDWDSQEDLAKLRRMYNDYNPRYWCQKIPPDAPDSQYVCVPDPTGNYENKETCEQACYKGYRCNPWQGCIPDPNPITFAKYKSKSDCEAKCTGFDCDRSKGCVPGDTYYTDKNDCQSFACRLYDSTYLQSPTKPTTCTKKNNIYGLVNGTNKDGYFYFSDMDTCKKQSRCKNWTCADPDNCTCADPNDTSGI